MEEELKVPVAKSGLKTGAVLGLVSILITILLYVIDVTLLANIYLQLLIFAGLIIGLIVAGIKVRNKYTGYMSFGQAFGYCLTSIFVMTVISTLFIILLYKVIDPEVVNVVADAQIENAMAMGRAFGASEAQLEANYDDTKAQVLANFTTPKLLLGIVQVIIFYLIVFSWWNALIIRKKEPIEDY